MSETHWSEIIKNCAETLGVLAVVGWFYSRKDRNTDVLLQIEERFGIALEGARAWIEEDAKYDQEAKPALLEAVAKEQRNCDEIDEFLRFYVVLCGIRHARQVPDLSLSTCYRFWLAHYYRTDRKEFRDYINRYFPTLRAWLLSDTAWFRRFYQRPFSCWWRCFFRPNDFWKPDQIQSNPKMLFPRQEGN
jgi:hypothetical protein